MRIRYGRCRINSSKKHKWAFNAAESGAVRDYDAKVQDITNGDDFAPQESGVGAEASS
jgi:hypothetical protein